jgi:phosphate transport system permease protein
MSYQALPPTAAPPTANAHVALSPRRPSRPVSGLGDALFRNLCKGAAGLVVLLAGALVVVLLGKAWYAITTLGPGFLVGMVWDPVDEPGHHVFGALPFIWGTLATSFLSMLIAVPLGIGTATFLAEIAAPWLRRFGSFMVEMLAAIPSVVYGFWGIAVLKPFLDRVIPGSGNSVFSASLVLSVMIVPYVAAVSFDVCQAVPRSQREGAFALGATRWQTIWSVVLPYARPGIIGGCFLALGRALGETMAVTMLIGNATEIHLSPFRPGNSIASQLASQYGESKNDPLYESVLIYLALVLLLVTIVVNWLARVLLWRMGKPGKRRSWSARLFTRPGAAILPGTVPQADAERGHVSGGALWANRIMTGVLGLCLAITLGPLFFILSYLLYQGVGSLHWEFFTKLPIDGGMLSALVGSVQLVGTAALFAVPVGLLASIYLAEYRGSSFGAAVRFIGELLMGVPSIVIGIFAAAVIATPLRLHGLAGAFALGLMMIPIVMRASEEALKLVPRSLRNASYALGAAQWQTVLRVTVPAALSAIVTAIFLAVARIGGETAPLLLTAGFNNFWPRPFPADYTGSLPMAVYDWSKNPDLEPQAWAAAFVLMVLVLALNFGIRFVTGKRIVLASRAD